MKEKIIKRLGVNRFFNPYENQSLIGLFDTSITTMNVGDEIINDSIQKQLSSIFPLKQFVRAPTHDGISSIGIYRINCATKRFICGSNIMNGKMFTSAQWNVGPIDILRLKRSITVGVGWVDYQNKTSLYSRLAYSSLLSKEAIHSVRDEYTKRKFEEMGFYNVINTACATMWTLDEEHCSKIPSTKANNVIFTLTDYRQSKVEDEYLINTLLLNYNNVYFWVQGAGDIEYFKSLNVDWDKIRIISPQLSSYDNYLKNTDTDFVGTRLHAGIRSLQHSKRTIIIGVDNRALEKQKDFNINVINRNEIRDILADVINSKCHMEIKIPTNEINKWKEQFN